MNNILSVILCGGLGNRLWPMSRQNLPKQFLSLIDEHSLFQNTIIRAKKFTNDVLAIGNEAHKFLILQQLQDINATCELLLEPCSKNTLASSIIACLYAKQHNYSNILILPSDHYLDESFFNLIHKDYLNQTIATFGIKPTTPSTEYGYIKFGRQITDNFYKVTQFVEKPCFELAQKYLIDGDKYWNSGMFLLNCDKFLQEVKKFEPQTLYYAEQSLQALESDKYFNILSRKFFDKCNNISIDYGVMEKTTDIYIVKCDGICWSDLGTWSSIHKIHNKDCNENVIIGNNVNITNITDSIIVNNSENTLVFCNDITNLAVCISNDAILISSKHNTEPIQKFLAENQNRQIKLHNFEYRPWGKYENIIEGVTFKVKRITVNPGQSISLQLHHKRDEHWIITNGEAEIIIGEEIKIIYANESVFIKKETKHKIKNIGIKELIFIEVQYGEYFGEDDIIRFDDKLEKNNII